MYPTSLFCCDKLQTRTIYSHSHDYLQQGSDYIPRRWEMSNGGKPRSRFTLLWSKDKNGEKINVENTGETFLAPTFTHRSPPTPSFLLSTKVAFTNKSKEEQADFSTSEVRKYEKYGEVQKSACFSLNKSYFSIFHQQS